jgi:hypothetical protein
VGHHAAVLVLAYVAVIDEVTHLGEGDHYNYGLDLAAAGAPGGY